MLSTYETMKNKIIGTLLCMLLTGSVNAWAQDLFREVLQSTTRQMKSVGTSLSNKKLAKFKYDALNYLQEHESIEQIDNNRNWFKQQVYFLSCFTELYQRLVSGEKNAMSEEELRRLFMKTSLEYPLFSDTDEERVLIFLKNEKSYTPFSLDTNWKKAYDKVKEQLPMAIQNSLDESLR